MKLITPVLSLAGMALLALPASAATEGGVAQIDPIVYLAAVFALACFVGYYVVWSVTPALHTPLMSVTNAISGVVVVGALMAVASTALSGEVTEDIWIARGIGTVALIFASINIFGGFLVTRRMLGMYKKKGA